MSSSTITLNVIPLNIDLRSGRFSFFKNKPEDRFSVPLNPGEMPVNLSDIYTEPLYTDFTETPEAEISINVPFDRSKNFAKHYMNHRVYEWFDGKARRQKDFVRNNVFYFHKKSDDENNLAHFDRFTIRAGFGRITDGFELTVMYSGQMKVWLKPVYDYPGSSTDFTKVMYDKQVYRYNDLMEQKGIKMNDVYPVVNRQIGETLGLPRPPWKKVNKMKQHSGKINWFYETYIMDDSFRETFNPSTDGFLDVDESKIHRVEERAANLVFGHNVVSKDPHTGMKKGGPYEVPRISHIKIFFICDEKDGEDIGNRLYKNLKDGLDNFPGLNNYARIPVFISEEHITFTDSENPFPEIREKLQQMKLEENITYCAIYISPIAKNDPDINKRRVYYLVKEELLKYEITSQVINRESVINPAFNYYLPNISVALAAKLGGTPWTLEQKKSVELVIGVGAYSPNRFRKTYLGSAFCFSNRGDFRGFNSFTADDHLMLAGSFQKAIKQFKEENDKVERVVIHFYKHMNREEAAMVKKTLQDMDLEIPVVILTIHKTGSRDLVLADKSKAHRLPLSGTWMRSGPRQFLLCNNTRFDRQGEKIRSYPYPIKVYIDLAGKPGVNGPGSYHDWVEKHLSNKDWLEELLEQVYQFSRLNWQTISIKSLPVTVHYPEMVARKLPWFEGDVIPEFGKRNFWFL